MKHAKHFFTLLAFSLIAVFAITGRTENSLKASASEIGTAQLTYSVLTAEEATAYRNSISGLSALSAGDYKVTVSIYADATWDAFQATLYNFDSTKLDFFYTTVVDNNNTVNKPICNSFVNGYVSRNYNIPGAYVGYGLMADSTHSAGSYDVVEFFIRVVNKSTWNYDDPNLPELMFPNTSIMNTSSPSSYFVMGSEATTVFIGDAEYTIGDINGDGIVDTADVVLLRSIYETYTVNQQITITNNQAFFNSLTASGMYAVSALTNNSYFVFAVADVNGDGVVNMTDVSALFDYDIQVSIGLTPTDYNIGETFLYSFEYIP